jgi:hypothetical protein
MSGDTHTHTHTHHTHTPHTHTHTHTHTARSVTTAIRYTAIYNIKIGRAHV